MGIRLETKETGFKVCGRFFGNLLLIRNSFCIIQERSLSEAEEILRYLFENVIIYYNPKFPRKYRDFGFETVSKFLDMTIGLNGLVDFYIRSRYTIDIIKEDLADETGLKEELCELVAGIIKENYQTLQRDLL